MKYDQDLTKSEQRNEAELETLKEAYDAMTRWERVKCLGTACDLSNRIARIEGTLRERRNLFDFPHHSESGLNGNDAAADTLTTTIKHY